MKKKKSKIRNEMAYFVIQIKENVTPPGWILNMRLQERTSEKKCPLEFISLYRLSVNTKCYREKLIAKLFYINTKGQTSQ